MQSGSSHLKGKRITGVSNTEKSKPSWDKRLDITHLDHIFALNYVYINSFTKCFLCLYFLQV